MASLPATPRPLEEEEADLALLPQGLPRFLGASRARRTAKMVPSLPLSTLRRCRSPAAAGDSWGRQLKLRQWRASTRTGTRNMFRFISIGFN